MVINLFRRDSKKIENPLLRALAVRSFGCLRVPKLNEYLIDPLRESLKDSDAYVRKTAVLCVPKVFQCTPNLVKEAGLIEYMNQMLTREGNPLVLANLVCALNEIGEIKQERIFVLTWEVIQKLLIALEDCIEWGQIFILDFIMFYTPKDMKETEQIIERVLPRLSHINPCLVFSAVKVIIKFTEHLK